MRLSAVWPLIPSKVDKWIKDHHSQYGKYPTKNSRQVPAPGENWALIDRAMKFGERYWPQDNFRSLHAYVCYGFLCNTAEGLLQAFLRETNASEACRAHVEWFLNSSVVLGSIWSKRADKTAVLKIANLPTRINREAVGQPSFHHAMQAWLDTAISNWRIPSIPTCYVAEINYRFYDWLGSKPFAKSRFSRLDGVSTTDKSYLTQSLRGSPVWLRVPDLKFTSKTWKSFQPGTEIRAIIAKCHLTQSNPTSEIYGVYHLLNGKKVPCDSKDGFELVLGIKTREHLEEDLDQTWHDYLITRFCVPIEWLTAFEFCDRSSSPHYREQTRTRIELPARWKDILPSLQFTATDSGYGFHCEVVERITPP
jgi:hypothetical protein